MSDIAAVSPEFMTIDVQAGAAAEGQSGLAMLRPRIWGALHRPPGARTALVTEAADRMAALLKACDS